MPFLSLMIHAVATNASRSVAMRGLTMTGRAFPGHRTRIHWLGAGLAVGLALCGAAVAGPFQDAAAAFDKGDYATALRLWLPLANQGDANAQYNLGQMYIKGAGVPQDYAVAAGWLRKAADQGVAEAQYNLGVIYARGRGAPVDYAAAQHWYRLAADQRLAPAQLNLGVMYRDGQGVAPDDGTALTWFRSAADQGDAEAQYNVGLMYQTGRGAPRDDAQAVAWWRKAADQGYPAAQNNLGDMYALGRGVPKNLTRAYMWISLAVARLPVSDVKDRAQALDNRRMLAAQMTATEIATARLMAGRWTPTVAAKPSR